MPIDVGTIIVSAFVSFAISIILLWLRDIFVFKGQIEYKNKKELVEKRLMYIYSPLYFNILSNEQQSGQSTISWSSHAGETGEGKEKESLDRIMENYSHLASPELQKLLAKMHKAGAYRIGKEDGEKMVELIKKEYEELRKELFDTKYKI